jgi:hypothetical protein
MTEGLRALLIPPQEARLRSRFGLDGVPLQLITSGWHRLIVAAPDRVFVFPRHQGEVLMLEREADVLYQTSICFHSFPAPSLSSSLPCSSCRTICSEVAL